MNNDEFLKLSLEEQLNYVLDKGRYVDCREYKNQTLALYTVGRYLYEIWYRDDDNRIVKVAEVKASEALVYYFEGI